MVNTDILATLGRTQTKNKAHTRQHRKPEKGGALFLVPVKGKEFLLLVKHIILKEVLLIWFCPWRYCR
jgi:hypothetical protein